MECKKETNLQKCNCTYPCERKGMCCECIEYHSNKGQLPACYFKEDEERTYNRSIEYFISLHRN